MTTMTVAPAASIRDPIAFARMDVSSSWSETMAIALHPAMADMIKALKISSGPAGQSCPTAAVRPCAIPNLVIRGCAFFQRLEECPLPPLWHD
jgi:hypothetical protein